MRLAPPRPPSRSPPGDRTCGGWLPTFGAQPGTDGEIHALVVHDDGSGPALFVGGTFVSAGGALANGIARWDGVSWAPLGTGLSGSYSTAVSPIVRALAVYDDGTGPALYCGGGAIDAGDSHVSRWGRAPDVDPPVLDCPVSVYVQDVAGSPGGETVDFTVTASDGCDPAPSVVCVPPSGSFFPHGTTMVACTAADSSGNQSACQFPVVVGFKVRRR